MKKTRIRVTGGWCNLCSTYIAKLAGVAPITARRFLYQFGKASNNSLTLPQLRAFIFQQEARRLEQTIRKELSAPLANDFADFMQRARSKSA